MNSIILDKKKWEHMNHRMKNLFCFPYKMMHNIHNDIINENDS